MNKKDIFEAHAFKTAKEIILSKLVTGDVLKVKSDKFPLINHYGIVVKTENDFLVYHNDPFSFNNNGGNIIKENALNWIKNKEIVSIMSTNLSKEEIDEKINEFFADKYHFFDNNCEHFISKINGSKYFSPQVLGYSILVSSFIIAATIVMLNNKK